MPTNTTAAATPRDPAEALIDEILRREGWPKYTNRPSDRGGPTKGGITLATLARWRKRPVTAADVEALDEAEVRAIYRAMFIDDPGFSKIADAKLRELVIDSGGNHGTTRASTWLQDAVNDLLGRPVLKVDGQVGPATLAAVAKVDQTSLYWAYVATRMRFYGEIITGDARKRGRTEDDALNAAGWLSRLSEFVDA